MFKLEPQTVRLGATPQNKESAIRQAGDLLVKAGYIEPGYVESMLLRELEANTYLGNGISIPHGVLKDKEKIIRTGISVLQVPQGVEWNTGEKAYVVVGIAARTDEHLTVLANLTDILSHPQTVQNLATTNNVQVIVNSLNGESAQPASAAPAPVARGDSRSVLVTIKGSTGLHARPATTFANLAKQFQSEIVVLYQGKPADGKSLISLLKLGAKGGATIEILAKGRDAEAALAALQGAVESGLGEEELAQAEKETRASFTWQPQSKLTNLPGISASPGLAIGPLYQLKRSHLNFDERARDPEAELQKFQEATEGAKAQLEDLFNEVRLKFGEAKAAIFKAHEEFLNDPELTREVNHQISNGYGAAWAWNSLIEKRVNELKKLDDPLLANRAVDLSDVGLRVMRFLGAVEDDPEQQHLPEGQFILVAEDLTPSDTANLDVSRVLGFCTAGGGPTSHSAIIARSLDIPAIVGAGPALLHLPSGLLTVLDGEAGILYINPTPADIASARQLQTDIEAVREAERLACYQPAIMTDGYRVEVVANIARPSDAEKAVNAGGEGIGLFRTEFLFIDRKEAPTEEEQFQSYVETIKALNGLPVIIRTLDIGGDKKAPYLNLPAEENPFLGVRGIRLCLERPELFYPQLRAIYRAAAFGPVRIMFPMITSLEDLAAAKRIANQVRAELNAPPVEIGIMVEVPSSAIMANEFAREVDFFSIGTNDLTQYTLAMDRLHPILAKQADGLHPAVLRLIDMVVKAARANGKWVGVCGGIAGDPKGAQILAGLGVVELSVTIPSIAAIKSGLRRVSQEQTQQLALQALACQTAAEVRALDYF